VQCLCSTSTYKSSEQESSKVTGLAVHLFSSLGVDKALPSLSLLSFIIYCTVLVKTLQYLLLCNGNTNTFLSPFSGTALMVFAMKLLFAVD
jgi:hypothetical protein